MSNTSSIISIGDSSPSQRTLAPLAAWLVPGSQWAPLYDTSQLPTFTFLKLDRYHGFVDQDFIGWSGSCDQNLSSTSSSINIGDRSLSRLTPARWPPGWNQDLNVRLSTTPLSCLLYPIYPSTSPTEESGRNQLLYVDRLGPLDILKIGCGSVSV